MILLIIYFAVGIILCGMARCHFNEVEYSLVVQILSYLTVMILWPILILLGIGKALYNAAEKDD